MPKQDNHIPAFCETRLALLIAFSWGLAEATVFFLVPDIFIGFVAIFNWRRGLLSTAYVIAGAMVGGAVMYILAANNAPAMVNLLTRIPLISMEMIENVSRQVEMNGLRALVIGPWQGIPYKIFAVQAGAQGLSFLQFMPITIIARLERMLPVALFGSVTGTWLRKSIQRHTWLTTSIYAVLWIGIYIGYYLKFR
jgi:membrane protein YqaA with SNARE-associated domain